MTWLAGWSKRIKLSIDAGDIDADLANFPILVYISAISGINAEDISCVFDELTSDANRKKIAVTTDDGTTQCYVEIEEWDDANEQAYLWVKVPAIDDAVNTDLYLYYDSTQADNDTYVGDIESAPAMAVWDANFLMVQHLRDATTSTTKDSTTNNNDGTKTSANNPIVSTSGKISDAQDFSTDGISYPNIQPASITLEAWINTDSQPSNGWAIIYCVADDGSHGYGFGSPWGINPAKVAISRFSHTGSPTNCLCTTVLENGKWYHIVGTYDGTNLRIYVNGTLETTLASSAFLYDATTYSRIGKRVVSGYEMYYDGLIDECRISNSVRTDSYIKASYESGRDHLLDWGTEESSVVKRSSMSIVSLMEEMMLV